MFKKTKGRKIFASVIVVILAISMIVTFVAAAMI